MKPEEQRIAIAEACGRGDHRRMSFKLLKMRILNSIRGGGPAFRVCWDEDEPEKLSRRYAYREACEIADRNPRGVVVHHPQSKYGSD